MGALHTHTAQVGSEKIHQSLASYYCLPPANVSSWKQARELRLVPEEDSVPSFVAISNEVDVAHTDEKNIIKFNNIRDSDGLVVKVLG